MDAPVCADFVYGGVALVTFGRRQRRAPDPTNSASAGPLLFSVAGLVSKVLWQRIYIIKLCMFNSYFSQLFGLRLAKINYYQISAQSLTSGGGMSLDFGYR